MISRVYPQREPGRNYTNKCKWQSKNRHSSAPGRSRAVREKLYPEALISLI